MRHVLPLAFVTTFVAATPSPVAAQQADAPITVRSQARKGPGIGNRRTVVPASSTEATADIGRRVHTHYRILVEPQAGAAATAPTPKVGPPYAGYLIETPGSLACIYKLVPTTPGCDPNAATQVPTGGSKMIAIVDAYHLPSAAADLQTFSTQFGLPPANFRTVFAAGTQPPVDAGWALEEALDIEMAHAMAPNASIVLVEAASANNSDIGVAIDAAYTLVQQAGGGQVSMSFGGSEYSGEVAFESHFAKQGFVTFYASTGDAAGTNYPSTSPNVVAVGGTSTSRATMQGLPSYGAFIEETAWASTGGGFSQVFARPSYQSPIGQRFNFADARAVPDVAAVASDLTPVWVYCSSCGSSSGGGWFAVFGTSVASPLTAGMANKWGAFHQSSQGALQSLYANAGTKAFFNPTRGVCGPNAGYFSTRGYDLCTGLGAPRSAKAF